jgi:hypothetical protein
LVFSSQLRADFTICQSISLRNLPNSALCEGLVSRLVTNRLLVDLGGLLVDLGGLLVDLGGLLLG